MTYISRSSSHTSQITKITLLAHWPVLASICQQLRHQSLASASCLVDNEVSRPRVPAVPAALGGLRILPLPLHPVQVGPRIGLPNVHGDDKFGGAGRPLLFQALAVLKSAVSRGVCSGMAARLGLRMNPYDDAWCDRLRGTGEIFNLTLEHAWGGETSPVEGK